MRFTDEPLPPAPPVTDATEVTPKAAVAPVRRIGDGERAVYAQLGPAAEGKPETPWQGPDRRRMCRRIHHLPVMLDTRSGVERRKDGDGGETPTHADLEA